MKRTLIILTTLLALASFAHAQDNTILVDAVKKELNRSLSELKTQPNPPYFISYQVIDKYTNRISASFGKLDFNRDDHNRTLDIDLRVGSYQLDNTHFIRGNYDFGGNIYGITTLPLEDDEMAIRNAIWNNTDKAYRKAIEKFEKAVANQNVKVAAEDTSADFSHEQPTQYSEPFRERKIYNEMTRIFLDPEKVFALDTNKWIAICKRLSEKFVQHQWLFEGNVTFSAELNNKLFVNTEGTQIQVSEPTIRLMIDAKAKAEDGMVLPLYKSYFAFESKDLPTEEEIAKDIDTLILTLDQLRNAPMSTTFSGPAILSCAAAGVFFHEIFGHRVEGFREKDPDASNTFKTLIGKKVLPEFMDVVFNPGAKKSQNGQDLAGYYKYDDEGMAGGEVTTVKNGIFERYLMSRSPIEGFDNSNGHGRKSQGRSAVTRQSNLMVIAHETVTIDSMRKMLIVEAKKQNQEYGLLFNQVQGGFTFTHRTMPNAFNVLPLVVYRIYVDGRPDELVRGVDLIGTPLNTFSNIIAAANDYGVFNGVCGAESGWVPVSASSPSLLVSKIETQKKSKSQARLPILPSPIETEKQ
ncbi:MAG: hypothetical protein LBO69_01620 [Ignavibacteria bacterium]|jgi:predicted Zn-dependent protease|nr:hypothetical protein [Ignavibacteria bacterium]